VEGIDYHIDREEPTLGEVHDTLRDPLHERDCRSLAQNFSPGAMLQKGCSERLTEKNETKKKKSCPKIWKFKGGGNFVARFFLQYTTKNIKKSYIFVKHRDSLL
jgi:hypothetical protein